MSINRPFAVRTFAVAALIGVMGAAGASIASADTVTELDPNTGDGAYCMVVADDGTAQYLYSWHDCSVQERRIEAEQNKADREDRQDRRDEAAQKQAERDAKAERNAELRESVRFASES